MVADDFFGRVALVKGMDDRIKHRSRPITRLTPSQSALKRIKRCVLLNPAVSLQPILPSYEEVAWRDAGRCTWKLSPEQRHPEVLITARDRN
jgi:hypothetical protein